LEFAVFYVTTLTAYRMLMTWVYTNTQSLSPAVLMHASYTGWLFVLYPATSPKQSLIWQSIFAAALWGAVAVAFGRFAHHASRVRRSAVPDAGLRLYSKSFSAKSSRIPAGCTTDTSRPRR
jgi:hypothetical protein